MAYFAGPFAVSFREGNPKNHFPKGRLLRAPIWAFGRKSWPKKINFLGAKSWLSPKKTHTSLRCVCFFKNFKTKSAIPQVGNLLGLAGFIGGCFLGRIPGHFTFGCLFSPVFVAEVSWYLVILTFFSTKGMIKSEFVWQLFHSCITPEEISGGSSWKKTESRWWLSKYF